MLTRIISSIGKVIGCCIAVGTISIVLCAADDASDPKTMELGKWPVDLRIVTTNTARWGLTPPKEVKIKELWRHGNEQKETIRDILRRKYGEGPVVASRINDRYSILIVGGIVRPVIGEGTTVCWIIEGLTDRFENSSVIQACNGTLQVRNAHADMSEHWELDFSKPQDGLIVTWESRWEGW